MSYLFDTNIVLHYLRQSATMNLVESAFGPFDEGNTSWIATVSIGELRSLAIQNKWGEQKFQKMLLFLYKLVPIDIGANDIFIRYAEIDAYSQGKLPDHPLPYSARNMGKNDLWIAACASILGATLRTTDADFNHLNGIFLPVQQVSN